MRLKFFISFLYFSQELEKLAIFSENICRILQICCGNRIVVFLTGMKSLAKKISLFHYMLGTPSGKKGTFTGVKASREINIKEKGTGEGQKRGK